MPLFRSRWYRAAVACALVAACQLGPDDLLPPLPPGHPLAYVSGGIERGGDIFLLSADGRSDANLTANPAFDFWPTWSPDGTQLAFESNRDDELATEIYVLTLATLEVSRLTDDSGFIDTQPAWSPLGDRIAFVSDRDSAGLDIYLMNTDGASVRRLTTDSADSVHPAWSPAGDRIAFASDKGGSLDIYVMDTLGGNVVNLTQDAASDLAPAWSPDRQKIAFHSDRDAVNFAVWVMDANGTNLQKVSPSNPPCEFAHWTPDGRRLAFDCDRDIWVANADGTGLTAITRNSQRRVEVVPRWKPVP
jgi:Tol biopolymer transport system component